MVKPATLLRARNRSGIRELRRDQLIRSTIESIARRGFAETTLANVADGAGLSRGIVNFHFQTKDALLAETLAFLSEDYRAAWRRSLEKAGASPAERLEAMLMADFEPSVCTRKKIAVWYAFWGESKSRPTYLATCGAHDQEYSQQLGALCEAVIAEGGYEHLDAAMVVTGVSAMTDGLWLDLLLDPANFTRERGRAICMAFLASLFPRHFRFDAGTGGARRTAAAVPAGDDDSQEQA